MNSDEFAGVALITDNASEFEILQCPMALFAERYSLKVTEKSAGGRSNYRPAAGRKVKAW